LKHNSTQAFILVIYKRWENEGPWVGSWGETVCLAAWHTGACRYTGTMQLTAALTV
jgi:hypothetical protein